jgi:hypothetical protein
LPNKAKKKRNFDENGLILKAENNTLGNIEKRYMQNEARQKRVILFENIELIQEEKDLKKLLYLFNQGKDLDEISDELQHLSTNEMVLMLLHLVFKGKIKKFAMNWEL